jgi:hypothetical protein
MWDSGLDPEPKKIKKKEKKFKGTVGEIQIRSEIS